MLIYSVYMRENAPEEAEIVLKVLDIQDPFIVWGLRRNYERPGSDSLSRDLSRDFYRVESPSTFYR